MNAITQTEASALNTATVLEAADPTKNLILVPLYREAANQAARTGRSRG